VILDMVRAYGFFGLAAVVVWMSLARLAPLKFARWRLEQEPSQKGPAILTRVHIREFSTKLWIAGVFVIFGVLQLIPHTKDDVVGWFGTAAAYSILVRMILALRASDRDKEEAVRTHPELR